MRRTYFLFCQRCKQLRELAFGDKPEACEEECQPQGGKTMPDDLTPAEAAYREQYLKDEAVYQEQYLRDEAAHREEVLREEAARREES